jgi:hypothetical protein
MCELCNDDLDMSSTYLCKECYEDVYLNANVVVE